MTSNKLLPNTRRSKQIESVQSKAQSNQNGGKMSVRYFQSAVLFLCRNKIPEVSSGAGAIEIQRCSRAMKLHSQSTREI